VSRPGVRLDRNELSIGTAPACLDVHRAATAEELSSYAAPEPDGAHSPLTRRLAAELAVPEFRIGVGHDGEEGLLGRVFDLAATVGATGRALLPEDARRGTTQDLQPSLCGCAPVVCARTQFVPAVAYMADTYC
jgi:hypothetical protein